VKVREEVELLCSDLHFDKSEEVQLVALPRSVVLVCPAPIWKDQSAPPQEGLSSNCYPLRVVVQKRSIGPKRLGSCWYSLHQYMSWLQLRYTRPSRATSVVSSIIVVILINGGLAWVSRDTCREHRWGGVLCFETLLYHTTLEGSIVEFQNPTMTFLSRYMFQIEAWLCWLLKNRIARLIFLSKSKLHESGSNAGVGK